MLANNSRATAQSFDGLRALSVQCPKCRKPCVLCPCPKAIPCGSLEAQGASSCSAAAAAAAAATSPAAAVANAQAAPAAAGMVAPERPSSSHHQRSTLPPSLSASPDFWTNVMRHLPPADCARLACVCTATEKAQDMLLHVVFTGYCGVRAAQSGGLGGGNSPEGLKETPDSLRIVAVDRLLDAEELLDVLRPHMARVAPTPESESLASEEEMMRDCCHFWGLMGGLTLGRKHGVDEQDFFLKVELYLLLLTIWAGLQEGAPAGLQRFAQSVADRVVAAEKVGYKLDWLSLHVNFYLRLLGALLGHNHHTNNSEDVPRTLQLLSGHPDVQFNMQISNAAAEGCSSVGMQLWQSSSVLLRLQQGGQRRRVEVQYGGCHTAFFSNAPLGNFINSTLMHGVPSCPNSHRITLMGKLTAVNAVDSLTPAGEQPWPERFEQQQPAATPKDKAAIVEQLEGLQGPDGQQGGLLTPQRCSQARAAMAEMEAHPMLSLDAAVQFMLEHSVGLPASVSLAKQLALNVSHNEHASAKNLALWVAAVLLLTYMYAPPPPLVELAIKVQRLLLQLPDAERSGAQYLSSSARAAIATAAPSPADEQKIRAEIADLRQAAQLLVQQVMQQRQEKGDTTRQHNSKQASSVGDSVLDRHSRYTPQQLKNALSAFERPRKGEAEGSPLRSVGTAGSDGHLGLTRAQVVQLVPAAHQRMQHALAAGDCASVTEDYQQLFAGVAGTAMEGVFKRRLAATYAASQLNREEFAALSIFDEYFVGRANFVWGGCMVAAAADAARKQQIFAECEHREVLVGLSANQLYELAVDDLGGALADALHSEHSRAAGFASNLAQAATWVALSTQQQLDEVVQPAVASMRQVTDDDRLHLARLQHPGNDKDSALDILKEMGY